MKKKKLMSMALACAMTVAFVAGCGNDTNSGTVATPGGFDSQPIVSVDDSQQTPGTETSDPGPVQPTTEVVALEVPADCYLSELTGLPISKDIKDQRPIAVMVDNEKTALPHYEIADCDIVYELMNSTANDRVTRLMCVRKDWKSIEQMGSIRSTRPTNIALAGEYNAILVHDGGPVYINEFIAKPYCDHLSSGFCRFDNGKPWEYREYVTANDHQGVTLGGGTTTYDGLIDRISQAGMSSTYNAYAPVRDTHFLFREYGADLTPSEMGYTNVKSANSVSIGTFIHTQSQLKYNPDTSTYDVYYYGELQKDAEDGEVVSFNNVILQCTDFYQYDPNGYLLYFYIDASTDKQGWYISNGEAIRITWDKPCTNEKLDYDITRFYDENGDEIRINPGKTYIALVPKDGWNTVNIQ